MFVLYKLCNYTGSKNLYYLNDSQISNFEMLSCLNNLDLCGLFFIEGHSDKEEYSVKKKVNATPNRLGLRAFVETYSHSH